ncbi:MAG: hypothetical protein ACOX6T_17295 [Myxococcales bacterium]|jgi:hypothetical protein
MPWLLRGLFAMAAWLAFSATAAAGPRIAADLSAGWNPDAEERTGAIGYRGRLGWKIGAVVPEIGGDYWSFPPQEVAGRTQIYRAFAGARLELGDTVSPGAYGHIGWGRLRTAPVGVAEVEEWGPTYDIGLTLDFRFIPVLSLGIHAEYDWINPDEPATRTRWLAGGIHAALEF